MLPIMSEKILNSWRAWLLPPSGQGARRSHEEMQSVRTFYRAVHPDIGDPDLTLLLERAELVSVAQEIRRLEVEAGEPTNASKMLEAEFGVREGVLAIALQRVQELPEDGDLQESTARVGLIPIASLTEQNLSLTKRESDVLLLLAEGKSNKEIAQKLNISVRTIPTYLDHMFKKLGATSRTQAVVTAIRLGLVSIPISPIKTSDK